LLFILETDQRTKSCKRGEEAMISFYLHLFKKQEIMSWRPFPGSKLYLFLLIFLLACKGPSTEEKKEVDSKKDSWQMTDQIEVMEVGPAEEDAFRQAAFDGEFESVKALLTQGVGCDAVDQDGHTALMFAAFNGHSAIVLYLLDKGAEIDRVEFMGRSALLYASSGSSPETVKILLDRGADPNRVDTNEHFSPLMHAAVEGHLEVVKVLMSHGADKSLKDVDGDDAAFFAAQSGHMDVHAYLTNEN